MTDQCSIYVYNVDISEYKRRPACRRQTSCNGIRLLAEVPVHAADQTSSSCGADV